MLRLAFLMAALSACSSSTAAPDTRINDLAPGERAGDRSRAEVRPDLAPDGPRPPAHWKTAAGPGLGFYGHSVTPLLDGGALIAGGLTYDPQTGITVYRTKTYRYDAVSNTVV